MTKYDITDITDRLDDEKYEWLKQSLTQSQYTIRNEGFLIDAYYVYFQDPLAETLYVLRWADG